MFQVHWSFEPDDHALFQAMTLVQLGRRNEAIQFLRQVLVSDPQNTATRTHLALLLASNKQLQEVVIEKSSFSVSCRGTCWLCYPLHVVGSSVVEWRR